MVAGEHVIRGGGMTALWGVALLGLGGAGCRDEGPSTPSPSDSSMMIATTGDNDAMSTGEVFEPNGEATDQCGLAPTIGEGRSVGSLRNHASELGGACGLGGPDAFFRFDVPRRSDIWLESRGVGFSPRLGVLPHTCTPDWSIRTMACTEGVGTWLLDVPAGASLVVSIGVDEDAPVLRQPPPLEGIDPLRFIVDVRLRNVLGAGDRCDLPGLGRCGSGTACVVPPADNPEASPPLAVCTELPGDTCDRAIPVVVGPTGGSVEVDPVEAQTDAHQHSCGGARTRERVFRLMLPAIGPHPLRIVADRPTVGLAVRAPGCLPLDERGCTAPTGLSPTLLEVEVAGPDALMFVELPTLAVDDASGGTDGSSGESPGGEEAPFLIEIERFESPLGSD